MAKLYVPLDGATLGTGLEESVQRGTVGRGIRLSALLNDNFNGTGYPSQTGNGTATGNGWTATVDLGAGDSLVHTTNTHYVLTCARGAAESGERVSKSVASFDPSTTARRCRFKVVNNVANDGIQNFGWFRTGQLNGHSYLGVIFALGQVSLRGFNNSGVLGPLFVGSAVLAAGATYYVEIKTDGLGFVTGTVFSDANYLYPVWSARSAVSTRTLDEIGFGADGFAAAYAAKTYSYDDVIDFSFSASSPVANAVSIPCNQAIDLAGAELVQLVNGIVGADTDTYVKIRYGVDGGAKSAFYTLDALKAVGVITPTTSVEVDLQFNGDGTQLIEAYDFCAGTIAAPSNAVIRPVLGGHMARRT